MTDSPKPYKTPYHEPIHVLPTMVHVVAMGLGGLLVTNAAMRTPVLGDAVAKFREFTHKPMRWVGGEKLAQNPHHIDLGDAGFSFFIDAVVSTIVLLGVSHTEFGRRAYDAGMRYTDKQIHNLNKVTEKIFGRGASPALG